MRDGRGRVRSLGALGVMVCFVIGSCAHVSGSRDEGGGASVAQPLRLAHAETFTIESAVLKERRRINVLKPTVYGAPVEGPVGVVYMPDGGIDEDFLHIAGLVQVLVSNGTMRPVVLVGIENTQRRRDMTGPTANAKDREIAPVVGGSAAYRAFVRDELMPVVKERYHTTGDAGLVGESLAGLFTLETLFEEPGLFGTYIAVDPSVWWNSEGLVRAAGEGVAPEAWRGKTVMVVTSGEPSMATANAAFAAAMEKRCAGVCRFVALPMVSESHATIYHPAALTAFRAVLGPVGKGG